jgi:hypothetical protein
MDHPAPQEGESSVIVSLSEAAMHMYTAAIDALPFPEDKRFHDRADVVLSGMRKLRSGLAEAASRNRSTASVIVALSDVRQRYDRLTASLETARRLAESDRTPTGDAYFVFTTNEEVGGVGGSYASHTLPGDLTLALEVGPAEAEYGTTCSGGPIVAYGDAESVYDKAVADRLIDIATSLGLSPQSAVLGAFESDASHAKSGGLAPRAGLLCLPTLSRHGYEVIARRAIPDMSAVLVEFLAS